MIQALCLLLPFAGQCGAYVEHSPAIAQLVAAPKRYRGELVVVTGRVKNLDQWRSRTGRNEEVFSLCDGSCVRVYMEQRSPLHDGQLVTVSGDFYDAYHAGRNVYRNEIEATRVLPRE